ncbi:unnamed protein product, partial [Amoebophrya sp. A120]
RLFTCLATSLGAFSIAADTAQAIEHGRSFSFAALKDEILGYCATGGSPSDQLQQLDLHQKNIHDLSENFRSHQGLLNFMAALVRPVVELFPDTDDLPREWSKKTGTAPTMVVGAPPDQLLDILAPRTNLPLRLTTDHMVIVPNEAQRLLAAQYFEGEIYTVRECKGLGRKDVLLWNCVRHDASQPDDAKAYDRLWPDVLDFVRRRLQDFAAQGDGREVAFDSTRSKNPLGLDADRSLFAIKLKGLYTGAARPKQSLLIYESEASVGSETLREYFLKLFPEYDKQRRRFEQTAHPNQESDRGKPILYYYDEARASLLRQHYAGFSFDHSWTREIDAMQRQIYDLECQGKYLEALLLTRERSSQGFDGFIDSSTNTHRGRPPSGMYAVAGTAAQDVAQRCAWSAKFRDTEQLLSKQVREFSFFDDKRVLCLQAGADAQKAIELLKPLGVGVKD